jgi:catechol-2,3-dioxygenase
MSGANAFLLERATAYYASPLGMTQYANGPAPWLNQGHYDDNPAAWDRSGDRAEKSEPAQSEIPFVEDLP